MEELNENLQREILFYLPLLDWCKIEKTGSKMLSSFTKREFERLADKRINITSTNIFIMPQTRRNIDLINNNTVKFHKTLLKDCGDALCGILNITNHLMMYYGGEEASQNYFNNLIEIVGEQLEEYFKQTVYKMLLCRDIRFYSNFYDSKSMHKRVKFNKKYLNKKGLFFGS